MQAIIPIKAHSAVVIPIKAHSCKLLFQLKPISHLSRGVTSAWHERVLIRSQGETHDIAGVTLEGLGQLACLYVKQSTERGGRRERGEEGERGGGEGRGGEGGGGRERRRRGERMVTFRSYHTCIKDKRRRVKTTRILNAFTSHIQASTCIN